MVVLSERDDVALGRDFEAAATRDFDVRALEFGQQDARTGKDGHVKAVAMRVGYENVAGIRQVDSVREVSHRLAADPAQVFAILVEHNDAVTLMERKGKSHWRTINKHDPHTPRFESCANRAFHATEPRARRAGV